MIFGRFVTALLVVGLMLYLWPALAATTQSAAVMAPLHQFMDGIGRNDWSMTAAACTSPATIIDDFPPHTWQGPTACADWTTAFVAANKQAGVSDTHITLGAPRHLDVTGDVAYVVVPASFTYKAHGKPMSESGSIWTVVVKKQAAGWRIAAWAWAAH